MAITLPDNWADIVGPVAAIEFNNAADRHKPGLVEWTLKLSTLTDDEFLAAAVSAIYDSASAGRYRGNWEHDHFKATACFKEAQRRHAAAGHAADCRGWDLYSEAHAEAMRSNGHEPLRTADEQPCTCGRGGTV